MADPPPAEKNATLFVRGLEPGVDEPVLEKLFSTVGPLRRCMLVRAKRDDRDRDGAPHHPASRGFAFVQFAAPPDAERALAALQGYSLRGRKLKLEYGIPRSRKDHSQPPDAPVSGTPPRPRYVPRRPRAELPTSASVAAPAHQTDGALPQRTVRLRVDGDGAPITVRRATELAPGATSVHEEEPGTVRLVFPSWIKAREALATLHQGDRVAELEAAAKSTKRARLIVRNWPFSADTEKLASVFKQYGPIRELNLPLSDPQKKPMGFGFVEFFLAQDAKTAVARQNGKKVDGRVVAVDYAVAKDLYNSLKTKEKADDADPGEPSTETRSGKPATSSADELARTVFVRNLLYETSADELRTAVTDFGQVDQAVLVVDPVTKRPRGTAFLRMSTEESAHNLLSADHEAGTGIVLQGRPLYMSSALTKDSAKKIASSDQKKKDDKRNIWLAKEGFIAPGSDAAAGLTDDDIQKRTKAEREKNEKLSKNPNTFVSTTRLCVRNLPKPLTEKMLKQLFTSACQAPKKKILRQAKVVRDDERVTAKGVARSKGYGFVEFFDHAMALKALRAVNNNPDAFKVFLPADAKSLEQRRLIVEFAVEDSRKLLLLSKSQTIGKGRAEAAPERPSPAPPSHTGKRSTGYDQGQTKKTLKRKVEVTESKGEKTKKKPRKLPDTNVERGQKDSKPSKRTPSQTKKRKSEDQKQESSRRSKPKDDGHFEKLVADYQKRLAVC